MTTATQTQRALDGILPWQRLGALRAELGERLAHYRVYRATFNELRILTDRELDDLGIDRGTLREVAWNAARKG